MNAISMNIFLRIHFHELCQDLSLAGQRKGMDSGTRSGLLWEVERILNECEHKPQILLMENVPQIHSDKDMPNFRKWMIALENMGYNNYWADMNASDYGMPQNRNRCFMVSILGHEFNYKFPTPFTREIKLSDLLEKQVDEKYYLSEKMMDYLTGINQRESKFDRGSRFVSSLKLTNEENVAGCITTAAGQRPTDNFIIETEDGIPIVEATKKGYKIAHIGDGIDIGSRMHMHRGNVQPGMIQTIKTSCEVGVVEEDFRIRKITPTEAMKLMGFPKKDTEALYEIDLGDGAIFHMAGDSICVNTLLGIFCKLYGLSNLETEKLIKEYLYELGRN